MFFAPALPLESVFDPTGAGDTFAGGFAGFLAQTENISFENMKKAVILRIRACIVLCREIWHRPPRVTKP